MCSHGRGAAAFKGISLTVSMKREGGKGVSSYRSGCRLKKSLSACLNIVEFEILVFIFTALNKSTKSTERK